MFGSIWQSIVHFVSIWSQNSILSGLTGVLAGSLLTLITVFFRQNRHFIVSLYKWLWVIFSKQGKDYTFERAYLSWIINQHGYLGLLPSRFVVKRWGEKVRFVDLEKVYVSLKVFSQEGDKSWAESSPNDPSSWCKQPWLLTTLQKKIWSYVLFFISFVILILFITSIIIFHYSLIIQSSVIIPLAISCIFLFFIRWRASRGKETYQLGDPALAIDSQKHLVICGDPGSGKTTLLKYLAVTCAHALRNSQKYGDMADIVKKRLLWTTRPFPMLVTLRRYSELASWVEEKRFIDVFFEEMPSELRRHYPEGFFERKLAKGNCLILLDAFDELGSSEVRVTIARRIGDFLNDYDHPRNRVIVTTRTVGYEGQLDRYGFQIRTVQPLNAEEIRSLIKQRYDAIALSETSGWQVHDALSVKQDMQRRSERLIEKIESMPRFIQLSTNPLLLSLIILTHRVKLEIPEERVLIYQECVEMLIEQWQRFKLTESGIKPSLQEEFNLSQKQVLLQALALNIQQQRKEGDRQTFLPQIQAQEIIADKLSDILRNQLLVAEEERYEVYRRKAAAWIRNIQTESGILIEGGLDEAGNPLIGFSYLTIQEYLAAGAINETPMYQNLLISHLLQPAWREVVLLFVTLTNDATSIILQLLNAPQQPEGMLLAGFCLAERVKHVKVEVQHLVLTKLKTSFEHADDREINTFGQVLKLTQPC